MKQTDQLTAQRLQNGFEALNRGQLDVAASACEQILAEHPDLAAAHFLVGLIAVAGVVGFLLVRTWGLGLAAGAISVGLWMWIGSLGELGDNPIGLAVANLFAPDTIPHGVTSVGAGLTFFLLLVAAIVAASRPTRPRR